PEPARGLSGFRRVLCPGGRAAVSVNTVPERSYNHQINLILTRYVPGLAEAVTRTFSLGEASRLEELFRECGFSQIETRTVKHTFVERSSAVVAGIVHCPICRAHRMVVPHRLKGADRPV